MSLKNKTAVVEGSSEDGGETTSKSSVFLQETKQDSTKESCPTQDTVDMSFSDINETVDNVTDRLHDVTSMRYLNLYKLYCKILAIFK